MNENLNLVEILKDCPKGTKLYSPVFGEVEFIRIDKGFDYPIVVSTSKKGDWPKEFSIDGKFILNYNDSECLLFPSKDQKDWSKFEVPTNLFDYSTLKPFDKILVRNNSKDNWTCSLFTYKDGDYFLVADVKWKQGIPYNDETKHLAGTKDMPDKKYIWWKQS